MCKCCCEGDEAAAAADGAALMDEQHALALCTAGISQQASYIALTCHQNSVRTLCILVFQLCRFCLMSSSGQHKRSVLLICTNGNLHCWTNAVLTCTDDEPRRGLRLLTKLAFHYRCTDKSLADYWSADNRHLTIGPLPINIKNLICCLI